MTVPKRILGAVLCLCLLYAAVPIRANAAAVLPVTVSAAGKTYQYAVSGKNLTELQYGTKTAVAGKGTMSASSTGSGGMKFSIDTGSGKDFKFCYREIPVTVNVPANTTYAVEIKFELSGHYIRESKRATAKASFQIAYIGESSASAAGNKVVFCPYNGTAVNTLVNSKNADNILSAFKTYKSGGDGKKEETVGPYNSVKKVNFVNNTAASANVTHYFGFWVAAEYGSKYTNKATAECTVMPNLTADTVKFDAGSGTVSPKSKTVTNGGTYGELPVPTRKGYGFCGWYTEKDGGGTEVTSSTKVTATGDHTLYALWFGEPVIDRWGNDETIEYGKQSRAGFGGLWIDRDYYDYLYEWYKCDDRSGKNAKKVGSCVETLEKAEPLYGTPTDLPVGKYYYYSVISYSKRNDPRKHASAVGPVVEITVVPSTPIPDKWPEIRVNLDTDSNRLGDYDIIGAAMKNKYSGASVPGTFTWVDPDMIFKPTSSWDDIYVEIHFTPDDSVNYNEAVFKTKIEVLHTHKYVDGDIINAAACTEKGKMQQYCAVCGVKKTLTIPAKGHDYENGIWITDSTQHRKQCADCDSTDTAADHVFGNRIDGKRTCEICGYEDIQLITVTITWNEMGFTYTGGEWNPETHGYAAGEWTVNRTDGNIITVDNQGDGEVTVSFAYTQVNRSVSGRFTDENGADISLPVALPVNNRKTARLLLFGKPERDLDAETVGTVTVCIGGNT